MSTKSEESLRGDALFDAVGNAVSKTPIWDLHTHLYPSSFGTGHGREVKPDANGLMLWGIDELLTYHYLVAEFFRSIGADHAAIQNFWALSKCEQAELIWKRLFVESTPLSEACRGVVTTLARLGFDPNESTLDGYRGWFRDQSPNGQIDSVMALTGVTRITMTNNVFDDNERQRWLHSSELGSDPRFPPVLRFDELVCDWPNAGKRLNEWGYVVDVELSDSAVNEVKRFLEDWIARMNPVYCAMSLPPSWRFPVGESADQRQRAGERCLVSAVLPVCQQHGLPLALMIGVQRGVNPLLREAGDSLGLVDVSSLGALCREHPSQQVLCTMLARENQHELAVTARKFPNLTPFGCWWFLNNPSLIEEISRMRLELLGTSFIPQHSDARVLEQLVYKWDHSRTVIASVLADKYQDLQAAGLNVTQKMIERDATRLLHDNVYQLLNRG